MSIKVLMRTPARSVGEQPWEFEVSLSRIPLGTLQVSKLGATWIPHNGEQIQMEWDEFDRTMQSG